MLLLRGTRGGRVPGGGFYGVSTGFTAEYTYFIIKGLMIERPWLEELINKMRGIYSSSKYRWN